MILYFAFSTVLVKLVALFFARFKGSIHQALFAADFSRETDSGDQLVKSGDHLVGSEDQLVDLWQDCSNSNGVWTIGNVGNFFYKLDIVNNRLSILDRVSGHVHRFVEISSRCVFDQPEIATGDDSGSIIEK